MNSLFLSIELHVCACLQKYERQRVNPLQGDNGEKMDTEQLVRPHFECERSVCLSRTLSENIVHCCIDLDISVNCNRVEEPKRNARKKNRTHYASIVRLFLYEIVNIFVKCSQIFFIISQD